MRRRSWAALAVLAVVAAMVPAAASATPSDPCEAAYTHPMNSTAKLKSYVDCRFDRLDSGLKPGPTVTVTATPSPGPTVTVTASPSATPSETPSASESPSATPTDSPTESPSATPTATTPAGGIVVLGRSFPDATTTGVPAAIKPSLTPYSGSCSITTANVKIDRKIITCDQLRLLGPGIEITNSIINGTVYSDCCYLNGAFSLTDSEVRGPNSTATVVGEARFKLLRVEVTGGSRSVNCNDTCDIRDSYIHGQYGDKRGIDHESGIRQDGNGTFIHNTIACDAVAYPNPNGGEGSGCSAAISGYGDFGTVHDNRFENNLISSGQSVDGSPASSYCIYGGSTQGKPYPNAHHIVFIDNILMRGADVNGKPGVCGIYGPANAFDKNAPGSLWQNNTFGDGVVIPPTM